MIGQMYRMAGCFKNPVLKSPFTQGTGTPDPASARPKKYGETVEYGLMCRFLLLFYHHVKEAFSRKD